MNERVVIRGSLAQQVNELEEENGGLAVKVRALTESLTHCVDLLRAVGAKYPEEQILNGRVFRDATLVLKVSERMKK